MCINCSYFTYFISANAQATPGQKLMDIYTISMNYPKIDINLAFDRSISQFFLPSLNSVIAILTDFSVEQDTLINVLNILKVSIMLLTLCWYLVACFSKNRQTFHDILFDTVVVRGAVK
jgi:uncharacterized RDD family membrane protein YckC